MNIIEEKPQAVLASSSFVKSRMYYAKRELKIGDLVELSADGTCVDLLDKGNYLGLVIALNPSASQAPNSPARSRSVCVLSEGQVELPLDHEILSAPALSPLKAQAKGLSLAKEGELACAYLLQGDTHWQGSAVVEFFYPPVPAFYSKPNKSKKGE